MSWMDSWSRPSKHQATPAPYYLLPGGESTPYCRTCGRVISSRKADKTSTPAAASGGGEGAKYCSARCRSNKPGRLDREIEAAFVRFLSGAEDLPSSTGSGDGEGMVPGSSASSGKKTKKKGKAVKGDKRILVPCDVVQAYIFKHSQEDDDDTASITSTDAPPQTTTTTPDEPKGPSNRDSAIDLTPTRNYTPTLPPPPSSNPEDDFSPTANPETLDYDALARLSVRSGTRVRPAQSVSQVNGSVGGEKGRAERAAETEAMRARRLGGQKEVREREMVRGAARRGVVFGFLVDGDESADGGGSGKKENRRKCEAVMQGKVVEPSFAKGSWGVRWREEW